MPEVEIYNEADEEAGKHSAGSITKACVLSDSPVTATAQTI